MVAKRFQVHDDDSGMLFHMDQGPSSILSQNESPLASGALVRSHKLYVALVLTDNGSVIQPFELDGADAVLLFPTATVAGSKRIRRSGRS